MHAKGKLAGLTMDFTRSWNSPRVAFFDGQSPYAGIENYGRTPSFTANVRVIDWNTLEVTGVKDEGKIRKGQVKTPIIVKVKESYTYHDNYLYDSDVTPPVHVEHVATGLGLKPDTSRGDSSQALIDFPKITGGTKRFRSGEDDEESMDG